MREWSEENGFHSVLAPLSLNTAFNRSGAANGKATSIFSRTRSNPEALWHASTKKQLQASSSPRLSMSSPEHKRKRRRTMTPSLPLKRASISRLYQHQHLHHHNTSTSSPTDNTSGLTPERQMSVSHCAHDETRSCPVTTTTSPRQGETVRAHWRRVQCKSSTLKDRSCHIHSHYHQSSPSLPLSRSSSFDSQDSACTLSSPLTSLCGRIEEGQVSSDCDYSEMVDPEVGSSRVSPLAYKRKGIALSLESHPTKKSRHDQDSPTKASRRPPKRILLPEVVIKQQAVSPWSKERKSGSVLVRAPRKKIETIDLCDSDDEVHEDDDDLTLLTTPTSMSAYAASSSAHRSSSVRHRSPVSGSSPTHPRSSPSTSRTPHRNAMEKMIDLMEDVFEAETDSTGGDGAVQSLSRLAQAFFSVQDGMPLMLKGDKIAKLVRHAHACPSSRGMASETVNHAPVRWSQLDPQELSRLLKIMHRGLDCATGLDPFPLLNTERKRVSPVKKRSTRKQEAEEEDAPLLTEDALEEMRSKLSRIAYSATVADGCLSILSKEGTNKVLLCEEMILPCLQSIKTALDNVVIPFAEACSEASTCCNMLLEELIMALGSTEASSKDKSPKQPTRTGPVAACAKQLATIFSCLVSSLPRLQSLLKKPDLILSETMAFVLANCLLPTFFVLDSEAASSSSGREVYKVAALASLRGGQTPMKSLRLSAIHVLRLTYERCEEQKEYIVTTILDSMQSLQDTRKQARRQHGLANGKAICSSTALLLQIIQASSQPVAKAKKGEELMDWEDESPSTPRNETAVQSDVFKLELLREGQEIARKAAKDIAHCLMHKLETVGVAKATKNAAPSESGFATVMESLVSDLLDTLCCPEWPASSMLLSQLCVHFCSYLDEEKGNHEVRSIALDQLGHMAKRWYESKLQSQSSHSLSSVSALLESQDVKALEQLNRAYWSVIESLKQRTDEDGSLEGAARFFEAQWGREMMILLYQSCDKVESLSDKAGEAEIADSSYFVRRVDTLVGQMVTLVDSPDHSQALIEASEEEATTLSITDTFQKLMHSFAYGARFDVIEEKLISASSGPNATNRNKAIRGLSYISEVDGDFLLKEDVRVAVQRCLYDESVNVRDTAVGLLGKFALSHPEHLQSILPSLKERMEDTALLIRKRALRLFRDIYDASAEEGIQVEAAVEIVRGVFDEEETMRELAVESAAQMWFGVSSSAASKSQSSKTPNAKTSLKQMDDEDDRERQDYQDEAEREKMQSRLCNIVQVANRLRVKPSPVQEVLQRMVKKCEGNELQRQMAQLVHLTIDNIVQAQQSKQEPVEAEQLVEQAEVIALLVQTNPSTLSIRKAKLLLPYLRGGTREAEIRLLKSLLAIFNSCLPNMASTASSFAKQLQSTLTPLVSRPSNLTPVIEELIKCYCTVVRSHTHDFGILIRSMQMCYRQVERFQSQEPVKEAEIRNARVLIVMMSLLAESADYDAIRSENPSFAMEIDQITRHCVSEEVVSILTSLLQVASLRTCAWQSLRFVCRAHPKLMMGESLGGLMETILKDGTMQDRLVVLHIVADIMELDSVKHDSDQAYHGRDKNKATPRKVAREELAGESDSQGSPVTFEIVGRYGDLVQALATFVPLQKLVLEIVEMIVLRGICHPLQYLSTIIALQTVSTDKYISNKAQSLHRHLINKSSTSINFRQTQHAREAWQFQQTRNGIEVGGCNEQNEALFETWYNTIKEQKKTRMDLLKALVKALDVNISTGACSQDDVHYARFVTENLAALKYKTVEEVVLVASDVQSILTIAGEQVQVSVQEEVPVDGEEDEEMDEESSKRAIVIGRMSTIMSMALRLLSHLREQYGLKEAQIARGVDKKASNVAAVRKGSGINVIALQDLPGTFYRQESIALAKREMNVFDSMLNCEGLGADADDYDTDD